MRYIQNRFVQLSICVCVICAFVFEMSATETFGVTGQ